MAFDKAGTSILSVNPRQPYEIWISEVDSSGAKRDPRVIKAAEKMRHFFLHYRQSELGCPSLANTLAEQAVDKVCSALKQESIQHPQAYLKTAFRHVVNCYLRRERRLVPIDSSDGHVPDPLVSETDVEDLERLIQINEILTAMDPQTLSVFTARRAGYTGKEIARRLGMTTNALYTGYCRGLTHVIKKFGLPLASVSDNQQVHGSEQRRTRRQEQPAHISYPRHS